MGIICLLKQKNVVFYAKMSSRKHAYIMLTPLNLTFIIVKLEFTGVYIIILTLFRKSVGDIVIASVCPFMLSPPKPLDRIQPNLVNGLLTQVGRARACLFLAPPPGALGRGQKVKY